MKKIQNIVGSCAFLLAASAPVTVLAHATIDQQQKAVVGSSYKAVVKVPHGCGSEPTLRLRVQVPEGMLSVKPMPKAGWTLDVVKKPYEKSYQYHGATLTEGVREITWTGKLSDDHYDEFVFQGALADTLKPDTILYFPVIQECEKSAERWIEIPAEGKKGHDYRYPAPGVKLMRPSSD